MMYKMCVCDFIWLLTYLWTILRETNDDIKLDGQKRKIHDSATTRQFTSIRKCVLLAEWEKALGKGAHWKRDTANTPIAIHYLQCLAGRNIIRDIFKFIVAFLHRDILYRSQNAMCFALILTSEALCYVCSGVWINVETVKLILFSDTICIE